MKTLGFVDYYISEWHANNYPAWIEEMNAKLGTDYRLAYAWAEEDMSPTYHESTDEWCARFGVEKCATIEELCEKADYVFILAPGAPEKHLAYAEKVLPFRKNTYIDKTFAPNVAEAKEIFALAEKYGTKFFSSSALRYAEELKDVHAPLKAATTGGGRSLEEYIIHQAEILVRVMDGKAVRMRVEPINVAPIKGGYDCLITYEDGRCAEMFYAPDQGFSIKAEAADGTLVDRKITSDYFKLLIGDILTFFSTGEPPFDPAQTLEVMRIREAAVKGTKEPGKWLDL